MKQTALKRQTPLKQKTPLKRGAPMRQRGTRGRINAAALDAVTPALKARSMGRCEAGVPGQCTGLGVHRHHRRRVRSDNRLANLMFVCLPCHRWIHGHVSQARTMGFLVRRNADPEKIAISTFRRVK